MAPCMQLSNNLLQIQFLLMHISLMPLQLPQMRFNIYMKKRTRSQFQSAPQALAATEPLTPIHCYMVIAADPQTYMEAAVKIQIGRLPWMRSIMKTQTWELVPLSPCRKLVRCASVLFFKQSWKQMDSNLLSQGFSHCNSDPNVYILRQDDYLLFVVIIFVDDLLITGSSQSSIAAVKYALHDRFSRIYLGLLHYFIGL